MRENQTKNKKSKQDFLISKTMQGKTFTNKGNTASSAGINAFGDAVRPAFEQAFVDELGNKRGCLWDIL